MIDQSKRNTLKNVAAFGVGTATVAVSSGVLARSASLTHNDATLPHEDGLIKIDVGARLASETNDLEVVLTNSSSTTTTITHMTPAEINTARGRFDFNALFEAGNLRLAAGESVIVPIQHHAVALDGSSIEERATELTNNLRRNVSVITDGNSFAATSVVDLAGFA